MDTTLKGPLHKQDIANLRAGDSVLYTGILYTARDAAHKRLVELVDKGEPLPFPIQDAMIYYVGPTPTKPGKVIGSAGPTTSYRMDAYTPTLLEQGLLGMVGKGVRDQSVVNSIIKNSAIYFAVIGGAAALVAKSIVSCAEVCYPELGSESIKRLEVVDFPMTVVIDKDGNDLYKLRNQLH